MAAEVFQGGDAGAGEILQLSGSHDAEGNWPVKVSFVRAANQRKKQPLLSAETVIVMPYNQPDRARRAAALLASRSEVADGFAGWNWLWDLKKGQLSLYQAGMAAFNG